MLAGTGVPLDISISSSQANILWRHDGPARRAPVMSSPLLPPSRPCFLSLSLSPDAHTPWLSILTTISAGKAG